MGASQSLAVRSPILGPPLPNPLPARATSIDFAAIIDPSFPTSALAAPTPSNSGPIETAAPHFLFSWGDSYTSNGFDISLEIPSQDAPEGFADDVGATTTGPGLPNWIEIVTAEGPLNTLNFDFARGGAAIDNRIMLGANDAVPDFVQQSRTFFQELATNPHPEWAPWDAVNSEFIIWFGRNDVYWQVVQNVSMSPRLDDAIETYFHIMDGFYVVGGRRFLVLGIPPMWREPIWKIVPKFAAAVEPSTKYWTKAFTAALLNWCERHPSAKVTYFDPQPIFLNFLNNPTAVGAPNDSCFNSNNTFPGNGTNCLWSDYVHPGEGISAALGQEVSKMLYSQGFYIDPPIVPNILTGAWTGRFASSYLGGPLSFLMGILSSPMSGAWW